MPLSPGTKLGPYEILAALGSGGMGEVYRARDSRLGRDVAVKVLLTSVAINHERLRRFESEARAAGALNHASLLAVYDLGSHEGAPYIVSELLEGETLRARLDAGSLGIRRAVEYGIRMAEGLAAAHQKGIVHRDLKPENVFLTRGGQLKILDFGLAKLRVDDGSDSRAQTISHDTKPGTVLGTVGYMSPEQVKGLPADARSDVFALGVVLYEMLSGRPAFQRESTAEAMAAILKEEPPAIASLNPSVPAPVVRIAELCLEKEPDDRFHSARDVAFALEAIARDSGARARYQSAHDLAPPLEAAAASSSGLAALPTKRWSPRQEWALRAALAVAIVATVAVAFVAGRRFERQPPPSYHQLTFRRGIVGRARFAPDGQAIAYSARWDGKPPEVFTTRLDLLEAQAISLAEGASLDGVHGGKALIDYPDGRLAEMTLVGGTPRDVAANVVDADWGPTGDIAVIRWSGFSGLGTGTGTRYSLEYPMGKILWESSADQLTDPRVSPDGQRVALIANAGTGRGGDVVIVERSGRRTVLSSGWMEVFGLAWSPNGREVWFSGGGPARRGVSTIDTLKDLHAVSLAGRERLLLRTAGDLTLRDVFRDGRVLVSHERRRGESRGKLAGDEKERDLTYLDGTGTVGISADGRAVLFQEYAQAGGPQNTSYLRRVGDSSPIRLGEGTAMALSPDGRRAIALRGNLMQGGSRLVVLSAGAESPRELPWSMPDGVNWAWWTPDSQRVVVLSGEKDHPARSYILQPPDGQPQPISPEGTSCMTPGRVWVPCFHIREDNGGPIRVWELRRLDAAETRPAPWIGRQEAVIAWSPDGGHAFVGGWAQPPFHVFRVDVATGRREPWIDTSPPDPAGVEPFESVAASLTPDGRYYVYCYNRRLSDLFLVEGLR